MKIDFPFNIYIVDILYLYKIYKLGVIYFIYE